jgi:hypothetical protein
VNFEVWKSIKSALLVFRDICALNLTELHARNLLFQFLPRPFHDFAVWAPLHPEKDGYRFPRLDHLLKTLAVKVLHLILRTQQNGETLVRILERGWWHTGT